jgi:hypothetical protein
MNILFRERCAVNIGTMFQCQESSVTKMKQYWEEGDGGSPFQRPSSGGITGTFSTKGE